VASFRATLEEIVEADLLLHVVDITHPHALQQVAVVEQTLADLGADHIPCIVVLNKVDRLEEAEPGVPESLMGHHSGALQISALRGGGIDDLLARVEVELTALMVRVRVVLPYEQGALIARFHEIAIVEHEEYRAEGVALTGVLWRSQIGPYEPFQVNERS
jgi:GTP-binding protein HflX